ncbi:signal recognition particle protein [Gehongia tenuis]|uniref:Signal recognition particle protein n=1 Tax=Gehongia tenuis TaxID=2763655 RepID=A0A926D3W2_9FIRM|nr:signal recognition particle protein [Gehongia tenuis]MBC8530979.1 signal recognition particle protein [Gehongia tenuis]
MAFEGLTSKLSEVFKKLTSRGKLSEQDVKAAMREVKMALLEADVNFLVVKKFIKTVSERAVGSEILESLTPGQQVIKVVNEELTNLMGSTVSKLTVASAPPSVYMLVGLQGAGKTTMAGKLAGYLKKQGKNPLLCACDIYRPAAIQQLKVLGEKLEIPVFEEGQKDAVKTALHGVQYAKDNGHDAVLLDTAGRLHIDTELMDELKRMKKAVDPHEILLVVDSMTGQDAVNVAQSFHDTLEISGVILTKLDGDTRGGAALSVKAVTGQPIKFAGVGEKLTDIEPFYPERMASRILGMGDVLSLIEKAQAAFDEKQAAKLEERIKSQKFDLEDFMDQLQQMKKMGSMSDILAMMPGMNASKLGNVELDEKQLSRTEAIVSSMTVAERQNPAIINGSRRKRIAAGSGTSIQQVNQLLRQFDSMKKMMRQFTDMERGGRRRGRMKFPFM